MDTKMVSFELTSDLQLYHINAFPVPMSYEDTINNYISQLVAIRGLTC